VGAETAALFDEGVPRAFLLVVSGVLGLIFGSFATALAYRLPRGESVSTGRSKCPNCGNQIGVAENIPVFSWVLLRGRCKHCRNKISARYPLTELTTALLFVAAAVKFGLSPEAAIYAGAFWALVVLTVIDLEFKLLPNKIVYPLVLALFVAFALVTGVRGASFEPTRAFVIGTIALLGVVVVMTWPSPQTPAGEEDIEMAEGSEPEPEPLKELLFGVVALIGWVTLLIVATLDGPFEDLRGAVVGAALFSLLLLGVALVGGALSGRTAMGGGDIKLAVALGALLGFLAAPGAVMVGIFLSFLSGGVLSIAILVASGDRKKQIPFGPFLTLGTVLGVLWGERVLDAYLGTF
jgi:leader peptidase (prepilin peptidase)/N-methyltransferase